MAEVLELEKGDYILTKDGRELEVLGIYPPAARGNMISRIDGIDHSDPSPMRTPVFAKDILRIVRKAIPKKKIQESIPAGQVVNEKDINLQEKVKEEVKGRGKTQTSSAEAHASAVKGAQKK